MSDDRRLIEDYLPIEAISKEASREKSVRKGHISTLHLWWARRPLVACRAAVYGALVPASQFVPENGPDNKKQSLGRANAAKFVTDLCKYRGGPNTIKKAQEHILDAHAVRLTAELAEAAKTGGWPRWVEEFKWPKDKAKLTREDIVEGRAPRPRVLDMFAGGGAIPLEALRLGCEAYALDLNPVAHIIQLCTLVYPQKYGKPDPNARGMTGPKGEDRKPTWGGLADEVRYWGEWLLKKVKGEIGDLYPSIPDLEAATKSIDGKIYLPGMGPGDALSVPAGYLDPVAYLWTRTVNCLNPTCAGIVPLVRQTWLCKKKGRYIALRMVAPKGKKQVCFEVVEATTERGLGFNPTGFSKGGNATCPFCGTVANNDYVKTQGRAGHMGTQAMAIVCTRRGRRGRAYLSADDYAKLIPNDDHIRQRIDDLCELTGLTVPDEPLVEKLTDQLPNYGVTTFKDIFTPRQMLCLLTFAAAVREAEEEMLRSGHLKENSDAVATYLALAVDRFADWNSSLCAWCPEKTGGAKIGHTFGRHALAMVWDFTESGVWGDATGSAQLCFGWVVKGLETVVNLNRGGSATRGSATALDWRDSMFDAVITDPPYYDNIQYSALSDFFYVWLKRTVGHIYPEHFAAHIAPKRSEAVASPWRHKNKEEARQSYEQMMARSFAEANRVLKLGGQMTVVYAHKTTLGWSTLVEALRRAGFTVMEAWPLNTEMKSRLIAMESAALASSIFLSARKRERSETGSYENDVQPELRAIVHERVVTLWKQNISGADLLIACVGAGLHAFTRFSRVEYGNGEEVPAESFLAEVETVVLETILNRLSKEVGGNGDRRHSLAGVDPATRFYILWRYTYRWSELDAGEAIIFANGTHVELEGQGSLSHGSRALIEKKKSKYRLRDFEDRGQDEKLGLAVDGTPAPLIDALHRMIWLMEYRPRELVEFLRESRVNREQMRLVAQALAGPALKGGEMGDVSPTGELASLAKLTANWKSVVEDAALTSLEREALRTGQQTLQFQEETDQ